MPPQFEPSLSEPAFCPTSKPVKKPCFGKTCKKTIAASANKTQKTAKSHFTLSNSAKKKPAKYGITNFREPINNPRFRA